MTPKPKLMSYSAYAKHRGCSIEAVMRAVESGRIKVKAGKKGERVIDPEVADKEWAENTDPMMQRAHRTDPSALPNASALSEAELEADDSGDDDAPNLFAAKAKKEHYLAKHAKLKYEQAAGSLVEAEAVKKAAFETGRTIRESLLGIPDRIAGELAGETDPHKVHVVLTREITMALEELSRAGAA